MSLFAGIGKLILVTLVSSAVVTPLVISGRGGHSNEQTIELITDKDFQDNCFVIAKNKDNQEQLLVCYLGDEEGESPYYLYAPNTEQENQFQKVTNVKSHHNSNSLSITLEKDTQQKTINLEKSLWTTPPKKEIELTKQDQCVINFESSNNVSLICGTQAPWWNDSLVLKSFTISPKAK